MNPRSIQATTRRNNATVQHSTTSQIKNRIIREKNSKLLILPVPSYARGKGRVKRNPLISIACAARNLSDQERF